MADGQGEGCAGLTVGGECELDGRMLRDELPSSGGVARTARCELDAHEVDEAADGAVGGEPTHRAGTWSIRGRVGAKGWCKGLGMFVDGPWEAGRRRGAWLPSGMRTAMRAQPGPASGSAGSRASSRAYVEGEMGRWR